jgi:hypothetical protein
VKAWLARAFVEHKVLDARRSYSVVFVYLKNGDCIEVQGAFSTLEDEWTLSCLDRLGNPVATFESATVETCTTEPEVAEQLEEEVCEDLTVIPS